MREKQCKIVTQLVALVLLVPFAACAAPPAPSASTEALATPPAAYTRLVAQPRDATSAATFTF